MTTIEGKTALTQPLTDGKTIRKASQLMHDGQFEDAEELYRQIILQSPKDPHAWDGLGLVAFKTGRRALAKECFVKAIGLNPSFAEFHNHLGIVHRASGEAEEAETHYRRALTLAPSNAAVHGNLGNALRDLGKFDDAIKSYRKAIELSPKSVQPRINLACALVDAKKPDEAMDQLRAAIGIDPNHAGAHKELGNVQLAEGIYEDAILSYSRGADLDPTDHTIFHNLATALQHLGKHEEAAESYQKALEINPDFAASRRQLAAVRKFHKEDREISELQRLLKQETEEESRAELYFALAKAYDDVQEYDKAFSALQSANQITRNGLDYNAEHNSQYVNRLIETFDKDFFKERRSFGSSTELPVFIIGMPRSGTTLVEQIICSHPQVFGAGELMTMHELSIQIPRVFGIDARFPEAAKQLDKAAASRLADEYLGYLRDLDDKATRITDKMPFNFRLLGLIALLFPKARIIHCRRNPMDVCLSCYFARFKAVLNFTYNLIEVGKYYRDYEKLMRHWRGVLDIRFMDVQYEELVAHQEAISRELISFCDLEWDDRCLAFYEMNRPVLTASNWQVRQPIYSTSVERWRNYEKYLGPLVATLQPPTSGVRNDASGERVGGLQAPGDPHER